jgi:hypothetical protein
VPRPDAAKTARHFFRRRAKNRDFEGENFL